MHDTGGSNPAQVKYALSAVVLCPALLGGTSICQMVLISSSQAAQQIARGKLEKAHARPAAPHADADADSSDCVMSLEGGVGAEFSTAKILTEQGTDLSAALDRSARCSFSGSQHSVRLCLEHEAEATHPMSSVKAVGCFLGRVRCAFRVLGNLQLTLSSREPMLHFILRPSSGLRESATSFLHILCLVYLWFPCVCSSACAISRSRILSLARSCSEALLIRRSSFSMPHFVTVRADLGLQLVPLSHLKIHSVC
eukprot:6192590-Pleurochrysis_carterae.AAC.1